jgi:hypothetical protein
MDTENSDIRRRETPLRPPRTWGFRFSLLDAAAIVVFIAIAAGLYRAGSCLWWLLAIAAGHFFLFCNVFRVLRRRELIWAAVYLLNVGCWALAGRLDGFIVLVCQLPVTAGVIAWEIKTSRYHGVCADRLNPALNDYLEGRTN